MNIVAMSSHYQMCSAYIYVYEQMENNPCDTMEQQSLADKDELSKSNKMKYCCAYLLALDSTES